MSLSAVTVAVLQQADAATTRLTLASTTLRATLEADMAHDALRADVLQALLVPTGDRYADARSGGADAAAALGDQLDAVTGAHLRGAVDAAVAAYPAFLDESTTVQGLPPPVADAVAAQVADENAAVSSTRDSGFTAVAGVVALDTALDALRVLVEGISGSTGRLDESTRRLSTASTVESLAQETPAATDEIGRTVAALQADRSSAGRSVDEIAAVIAAATTELRAAVGRFRI